jgi:hypothetical protein
MQYCCGLFFAVSFAVVSIVGVNIIYKRRIGDIKVWRSMFFSWAVWATIVYALWSRVTTGGEVDLWPLIALSLAYCIIYYVGIGWLKSGELEIGD